MDEDARFAPDRHAVGLTVRLLGRTLRWVGPALVELVWLAVVLAQPGPVPAAAVGTFPALVLVGCWLAVAAGNVDDDGHRELCTAAVGSPGRLVVDRALAGAVLAAGAALLAAVALCVGAAPRVGGPAEAAAALAVCGAGALAGIGLGSLLHRPLVRRPGPAVVGGVGGAVVVVVAPPTTALLRAADGGSGAAAVGLLVAALAVALLLVAGAGALTERRAR